MKEKNKFFKKILLVLVSFLIFTTSLTSCSTSSDISIARNADLSKKNKDYKKAITLYQEHLNNRLKDKKRPKDENPYFYLVLIGDCYLEQGDKRLALKNYMDAKKQSVDSDLIADRIVGVSRELSDKGMYNQAISLLKTHRELDELLFDSKIDSLHKQMIANEEFPVRDAKPIESSAFSNN